MTLDQMMAVIQGAQFNFPGGAESEYLSGNTISSRTVNGATNWYQALAAVGEPINTWRGKILNMPGFTPSAFQNKIWSLGRDAAFLGAVLRRSQLDGFRWKYLQNEVRKKPGVPADFAFYWHTADNVWNGAEDKEVIDFQRTLDYYHTTQPVPDIDVHVRDVYNSWINKDVSNREHTNALNAAGTSLSRCGCTRTYPTNLKKRDMAISYDWGGPKAARSMRMKLRMLGSPN
jgi:hypothetical protein